MVKSAVEIYRDWETEGVPASGAHRPIKADIRTWGRFLEDQTRSVGYFGAVGDGTTANATAFQSAETAYGLNSPIFVPPGTYLTAYTPAGLYYGPGIIKIGTELIPLELRTGQRVNTAPPAHDAEETNPDMINRRQNVVIGQSAGTALTAASDANAVFGYKAGRGQAVQGRLTAIGYYAGGMADGYGDTLVGASAAGMSAFRERNVVIGATAGKWLGTNDPVGTEHDLWISTDPTYWGLKTRNPTFWSLLTVGGVEKGTPIAAKLPTQNPDAARNVIIGRDALNHSPKAFGNVAVGYRAARFFYNAEDSVAIGYETMGDGLFSYRNNAVGATAMNYLQTGQYNDALGYAALKYNAFADFNVAMGPFALLSLGTGFTVSATAKAVIEGNTAVGRDALRYATQGLYNTAVGHQAMGTGVSTGDRSTAIGHAALYATTSGQNNVAVGQRAGFNNVTGSNMVLIGASAGELDQAGTIMTNLSGVVCIGEGSRVSAANQVQLGNSATTTYVYGTVQSRSDERDKADIRDTTLGLDFIMALRPVDYRLDYREDYEGNKRTGARKRTRFHHGFIAQDIGKLIAGGVIEDFGGFQDHARSEGGCEVMSLGYGELLAPLVSSLQQVVVRLEQLEKAA